MSLSLLLLSALNTEFFQSVVLRLLFKTHLTCLTLIWYDVLKFLLDLVREEILFFQAYLHDLERTKKRSRSVVEESNIWTGTRIESECRDSGVFEIPWPQGDELLPIYSDVPVDRDDLGVGGSLFLAFSLFVDVVLWVRRV